MHVFRLHHMTIWAPDHLLEKARDFYINVLGLHDGDRPKGIRPGYWLYAGETPIVHLSSCPPGDRRLTGDHSDTGYLDHVAFACRGFDAMCEKLKKHNIPFKYQTVPNWSPITLIYIRDPAGTSIELTFHNELPAEECSNKKMTEGVQQGLAETRS